MLIHRLLGFLALCALSLCAWAAPVDARERPEWRQVFDAHAAQGTLVVVDERTASAGTWVYDATRAQRRYAPASTFKIAHTLFALDAGLVRDEFQRFVWDGVQHPYEGHNQDQTLRSAMRESTLWVYERLAKQLGQARAQQYLRRMDYGNADASAARGNYWVDSNLAISAHEQVAMLRRLFRNQLPFSVAHQRLVKDLLIVEAGRDWILRAKTGWEGRFGWWVGWVEQPSGAVFFALNIDTPKRTEDLYKRQAITRQILQSIDALPAQPPRND